MKLSYKHTICASYAGYVSQAVVNNLAPLFFVSFNKNLDIPYSKITLIITANFIIQLIIDFVSATLIDKFGYKKSIVTAHFFCAAGLAMLGILPSMMSNAFVGIMISVVFYAVGGGFIEVLISPIVEACPTENKASSMSLLHSFYCWGTVFVVAVTTVALNILGSDSNGIIACLWALLPFANAFVFMKVPVNALSSSDSVSGTKSLLMSKKFWLYVILMICAGASEQAMSQWASAFAESGLGVSKTIGDLAGVCMFSVFMGTARVINSKMNKKFSICAIMICSGILCIVSYMFAGLSKNAFIGLLGCALCGFSVGVLWPSVFSMASADFKSGSTQMFAFLALAGDLGCAGGPTLVGEISSSFSESIKTGLVFAIVFPIILTASCLYLCIEKRKTLKK